MASRRKSKTLPAQVVSLDGPAAPADEPPSAALPSASAVPAEQRAAELEALRQVTLGLAASLELEAVLDAILASALKLLPEARYGDIFFYHRGRLTFGASRSSDGQRGKPFAEPRVDGLTYTVARSAEPVLIPDMSAHPFYAHQPDHWPRGAIIGLPLQRAGQVVGVMNVAYGTPRAFPEAELRVLQLLSDQAAVAIQNAWLYETTRRQVQELSVLHQVAIAGSEATDEDALIERATHIIGSELFPNNFGILLLDPAAGVLRLHPSYQGITHAQRRRTIVLGLGLTGAVAVDGQARRVPDVRLAPGYFEINPGTVSELCVPLKVGDRILGVVNAESERPEAFTEADERLLTTLGGQLAQSIERLRVEAAQRHAALRAAESRAVLYRASQEISGSLDPHQVYTATHQAVVQLMPCHAFLIALVNEEEAAIELVYATDRGREVPMQSMGLNEGLTGYVVSTGRSLRVNDAEELAHIRPVRFGDPEHVVSLLAEPMRLRGQVFGMLSAQSYRPNSYSAEDQQMLSLLANQAAVAIEHARLFEAQREQRQLAEVLRETGVILSASLELDAVLDRLLEQVARVVPYDTGTILLVEGPRLRIARHAGYERLGGRRAEQVTDMSFDLETTATVRRLVETGQAYIIPDTRNFPGWVEVEASNHIRSWIGAPLLAHGEVIAVFALDHARPNAFLPKHARHLATFAGHAALAVKNAQLYEAERRRVAALTALHETGLAVSQQLELSTLLQTIVKRAALLLGADSGGLYLLTPDESALECVVSLNRLRSFTGIRLRLDEGVAGRVVTTGRPLVVDDYYTWDGRAAVFAGASFRAVLGTPIEWQGRNIGALILTDDRPGIFASGDVEFSGLFAAQAAVGIVNARLYADVRGQATELGRLYQAETVRARHLALLNDITRTTIGAQDLPDMLQALTELLAQLFAADASYLALWDEERHRPIPAAAYGELQSVYAGLVPEPREITLTESALLAGQALVIDDVHHSPHLSARIVSLSSARSMLVLPLVAGGRRLGAAIIAFNVPHTFSPAEVARGEQAGGQVALAIARAQLFDETRRRAEEATHVSEVLRALNAMPDVLGAFPGIVAGLRGICDCDRASLAVFDAALESLTVLALDQPRPELEAGTRLPLSGLAAAADVLAGRVHFAPDLAAETDYPMEWALYEAGHRSSLSLPLRVGARVIGTLALFWPTVRGYGDVQLAALSQIAEAVALALEKHRLFDETRRRADELGVLAGVSGALRAARTVEDMLPIFLQKACAVTGAQVGGIYLVDPLAGDLVRRGCHPPNPEMLGARLAFGQGITGQVAATGQMHVTSELAQDPAADLSDPTTAAFLHGVRSNLAVPLRSSDGVVGVMHVGARQPHAFTPTQTHLLTAIAEIAANALQRAGLLETLEQRVEARTRELAQANERLQELDRLKDQFISNVSHELRTPLTNIKLHLSLLDKRGEAALDKYLPTLQRETERLRRLIEDLLDLSRLQAQIMRPRREQQSLDGLIDEVTALHATRAEARGLTLEHDPNAEPLQLDVDRAQMLQVFTNLVGNAVAYTPAGGCVRVTSVYADQEGQAGVAVRVHNTGATIPPDDLPHLFERFFRGRTGLESGEAGTGLGLSICREIVEQHGGSISVHSSEVEGTAFTVWLPLV